MKSARVATLRIRHRRLTIVTIETRRTRTIRTEVAADISAFEDSDPTAQSTEQGYTRPKVWPDKDAKKEKENE